MPIVVFAALREVVSMSWPQSISFGEQTYIKTHEVSELDPSKSNLSGLQRTWCPR